MRYLVVFLVSVSLYAQRMETLTYFSNDTLSLQLDLFRPEQPVKQPMPLLLYVHGGGFSGGDRTSGHTLCRFLASKGYAAATLSYTLYMKNKKFSCDGVLTEKIRAFRYAASDLWQATAFFLRNAKTYSIDPNNIFIAGSSAGGETVLHAAFWDRKRMDLYKSDLPDGFRYAGLISGAGAIMDLNLIRKDNQIPMLLFHGNGDRTVPYGAAAHHYCPTDASGWLMLFGSGAVYDKIVALGGSAALYTYCGGGHEYSGTLFEQDLHPVWDFLTDVLAGTKFQSHTIIATGKKNELSAAYSFCD